MGQDIHSTILLKPKSGKKYITLDNINMSNPLDSHDRFHNRYYDFFGILGSCRSDAYPKMETFEYGIPEQAPTILKKVLTERGFDYHSFEWMKLPDMIREFKYYKEKLKDPSKFMLDMDEEYTNLFELPEWKDESTNMINHFTDIIDDLKYLRNDLDMYKDYIIPDETIILIYFDN